MPRRFRPADVELPDADTLDRLKLSPEVAWYLLSRGYSLDDLCPPAIKTPEPGEVVPGAEFDPALVDKVIEAFKRLRHTQGRFAGKPMAPDTWQVAYVIAPVFGWVQWSDEAERRVRVVSQLYVDIPRKNGKTTLAGGFALYLTGADGEHGAQVLAAATTKDQAKFCFEPVKNLVTSSPDLKAFKPYASKIVHPKTGSYFQVIANAADAQHGANVHGAIIDELHVHKDGALVEAIETGTGSRDQPLVVIITTADDGQVATVYANRRKQVERIADRAIIAPSQYGVVWAADEDDDPFAEETWRKANPGLGISPTVAYLRRAADKARDNPVELASFLRLHLGRRVGIDGQYLPLSVWDRNAGLVDEDKLRGRDAFGGLDLASTGDLTALCWVVADPRGVEHGYDVLWRHWIPERAYEQLVKRTSGNAKVWRDRGWLTVTEGDVTDYGHIRHAINADRERFNVRTVAYDRWNSSQLINDLTDDGCPVEGIGQGFVSMSPPTKGLLHLLLTGTAERPMFRHGGNPLVRWQVTSLRVATDPAGNVKPAKDRAVDKIDGLVASIMAFDRAVNTPPKRRSAYEEGGLAVINA